MDPQALLYDLNGSYGLNLREGPGADELTAEGLTTDALEAAMAEKINAMITGDFSGLIRILYRIDVSESRLRQLLQENKATDAGRLIARLILERLWQKILTRREYSRGSAGHGAADTDRGNAEPDDEEKW